MYAILRCRILGLVEGQWVCHWDRDDRPGHRIRVEASNKLEEGPCSGHLDPMRRARQEEHWPRLHTVSDGHRYVDRRTRGQRDGRDAKVLNLAWRNDETSYIERIHAGSPFAFEG